MKTNIYGSISIIFSLLPLFSVGARAETHGDRIKAFIASYEPTNQDLEDFTETIVKCKNNLPERAAAQYEYNSQKAEIKIFPWISNLFNKEICYINFATKYLKTSKDLEIYYYFDCKLKLTGRQKG
jgi:hypothetical protein